MSSKVAVLMLLSFYAALIDGSDPSARAFPATSIKLQLYFGSQTLTKQLTADELFNLPQFNRAAKSYFITHGWGSSINKPWFMAVKEAILAKEPTANVFMVDWSPVSQNILYPVVKTKIVSVAKYIATFIAANDIDAKKIHFIGHSLGAHVAGNTAHEYYVRYQTKFLRVTGLDPAIPLFSDLETSINEKLDKTDADLVDTIYTSMAFFKKFPWLFYSMGHVNFYVNGGDNQPGCLGEIDLSPDEFKSAPPGKWKPCSHDRSIDLFVDSIKYDNLVGYKCSYLNLLIGRCSETVSNRLGFNVKADQTGDFVLTTMAKSPFAKDDFNLKLTFHSIAVPWGTAPGTLSVSLLPWLTSLPQPVLIGQAIQIPARVPFGSVAQNLVATAYWTIFNLPTSGVLTVTITLATPDPNIKSFTFGPTPAVLRNGVKTSLIVK